MRTDVKEETSFPRKSVCGGRMMFNDRFPDWH